VSEAEVRAFCAPHFAGLSFEVRLDSGAIANRIVQVAGEERADVIVMATRGHDSLGDRLLGTHTERVVRHAPCPVLVS
jgi:nucleotide-binding universal stress UspA family protein